LAAPIIDFAPLAGAIENAPFRIGAENGGLSVVGREAEAPACPVHDVGGGGGLVPEVAGGAGIVFAEVAHAPTIRSAPGARKSKNKTLNPDKDENG
jgi:hypothetical protein